jgi:2-keto-4-pentenoate hydratase
MGKNLANLARLLLQAQATRRQVALAPGEVEVADAADAYAVQDLLLADLAPVGGWKLLAARNVDGCRCSPQPARQVLPAPADLAGLPLFAPRVEVEIAVRFGKGLPKRGAPYSDAEVYDAIGSLHPSIEVLDSRYLNSSERSALKRLADLQTNGAIVFGPGKEDWRSLLFEDAGMELQVDGETVRRAHGGPPTATVLAALTWLANHACARNRSIEAGHIVITGAPHMDPFPVKPGAVIEARVAGLGSFETRFPERFSA